MAVNIDIDSAGVAKGFSVNLSMEVEVQAILFALRTVVMSRCFLRIMIYSDAKEVIETICCRLVNLWDWAVSAYRFICYEVI